MRIIEVFQVKRKLVTLDKILGVHKAIKKGYLCVILVHLITECFQRGNQLFKI